MRKQNTEKVILEIPKEYFENKDELLGAIIRYGTQSVLQADVVPWELQEFGTEKPMSSTEIAELCWIKDRQNFHYHFKAFVKFMKDYEWVEVVSLVSGKVEVYSKAVVRKFVSYLKSKGKIKDIVI